MKRLSLLFAAGALLAAGPPAAAQEWKLRPGDRPLSIAELDALEGQVLRFFDGAEAVYGPGGAYSYTYSDANGGGTAQGRYEVAGEGEVCTSFPNGFSRCDYFVENGGRLAVITEQGERYPVRGN